MALAISETLNDYLRFVTYIMFDTLDSILSNNQIYFNDYSNQWKQLYFHWFSTYNALLPLFFKKLPDIVDNHLIIVLPTDPRPLLIYLEKDEDSVIHLLCYLLNRDTLRTTVFGSLQFELKYSLGRRGCGRAELGNRISTRTGEDL